MIYTQGVGGGGWAGSLSACSTAVADPGFHRGGCQLPRRGPNPLFGIIFAANYMKMKKKFTEAARGKGMGAPFSPKMPLHRSVSIDCSGGGEGAADIKA